MTLSIGTKERGRSLTALVQRRRVPSQQDAGWRVLDLREQDICRRIARQLSNVLGFYFGAANSVSLRAIGASFDEQVIAERLQHENRVAEPG